MEREQVGVEQLQRLLAAVVSVGSDLDLSVVLRRLTQTALELVGARFAALGVLDADRVGLSDFITVGLSDEEIATIGRLPEGHGILGVLIEDPRPLRLPDLAAHPDSYGFPPNHPPMRSFLGVPVLVGGTAFGNLYLTDKFDGEEFSQVDEDLAVALASAAGTAIEKARLHARVRELDVAEDRARIARDLHDTVIQRLFATGLSLQAAARSLDDRPDVVDRLQGCVDELDAVVREVRSSIHELHPTASPDGLRRQLVQIGDDFVEALGFVPEFRFDGPVDTAVDAALARHVTAVVSEAIANTIRHAEARRVVVTVTVDRDGLVVEVVDDGRGSDAAAAGGTGRGRQNMAHRAELLGGTFATDAPEGGGTRIRWSIPS